MKRFAGEAHYCFVRSLAMPTVQTTAKDTMMTHSKAVPCKEIKSEIYIYARQRKLLIWGEMDRQGCMQTNGQLALRSDGTGTWSCVTTSRNPYPGDVWHADFAIRDERGATLFGIGPFYSPRMCAGDAIKEYRWAAPFTFPADLFEAIYGAVQNCGTLPPICAIRQAGRPEVEVEEAWHQKEIGGLLQAYA